jgi:inner membrane protein
MAAGLAWPLLRGPDASLRWKDLAVLSALSFLPDADVVAFAVGIPYEHAFGHRGASHSIAFALFVSALLLAIPAWTRETSRVRVFLVAFLTVASHGVLDMLTDGGLGVAVAWPLSSARHFFSWTPLPVAPIGGAFLSARGLSVLTTEVLDLLLPVVLLAVTWTGARGLRRRSRSSC